MSTDKVLTDGASSRAVLSINTLSIDLQSMEMREVFGDEQTKLQHAPNRL
jgi:hypothetical protein